MGYGGYMDMEENTLCDNSDSSFFKEGIAHFSKTMLNYVLDFLLKQKIS